MRPMTQEETVRLFWASYILNSRGCWIWQKYKNKDGYGKVTFMAKTRQAHRLAWELRNGEIPGGLNVLHSCDTPACINPDHLFLGTTLDNVRDKQKKGRSPRGDLTRAAKLTWPQVNRIRRTVGLSQSTMANKYGVCQATISNIRLDKTWRA